MQTIQRQYTPLDQIIHQLDTALRTIAGKPIPTERPDPAESIEEAELSAAEKQLSGNLMRVNHAGEVSAQGLYQGQALTAKLPEVRDAMERAAQEENDHLVWCENRINALDTHKSWLGPFWYFGSFTIGSLAGLAGDKWSLGFVAETERQVVKHLDEHLQSLPEADKKSRAVLEQMKEDEAHHATVALEAGAAELPEPVKQIMGLTSKIMTTLAFRL
ncbi:MAG: demethoxyubiquinone hydroxylase family protein [Gammaproteobacteria bacterium]|nr:MAG: demethoxyubiquinone hydroxylase family protein [Gammaproteobacteria bacterium]RTZ61759.1 MAG: demethoxyubiquinone hydroxylase family protein [Gammaproteobacteria bacterium]